MATMKKTDVNLNDFYVWFRKKVRDPLVQRIKDVDPKVEEALDTVIPQVIFDEITRRETNPRLAGVRKTLSVIGRLIQVLESYNVTWLAPILIPAIEGAVRFIYRKYFETVADKFGFESKLEEWFGAELDSGDKEPEKEPEKDTSKKTTSKKK